jgi:hypothetical protein
MAPRPRCPACLRPYYGVSKDLHDMTECDPPVGEKPAKAKTKAKRPQPLDRLDPL